MRPVIAFDGVPCLQMRSAGPHSISGGKKTRIEGNDEAKKKNKKNYNYSDLTPPPLYTAENKLFVYM